MDILTKQCTNCFETKVITEFYNRSSSKDGLEPVCKPCKIQKALQYKCNPKPKAKPAINEDGTMKFCGGCETEKSVSEFYKAKGTKDGFSGRCITCYRINYLSNKDLANKKALQRYYNRLGKPMPESINQYNTKLLPLSEIYVIKPTIDLEKLNEARKQWRAVFEERYDDIMKMLKEYDEDKGESLNLVKTFHAEVRPKWKLKHNTTDKYEAHFAKYGSSGW